MSLRIGDKGYRLLVFSLIFSKKKRTNCVNDPSNMTMCHRLKVPFKMGPYSNTCIYIGVAFAPPPPPIHTLVLEGLAKKSVILEGKEQSEINNGCLIGLSRYI